MSTDWYDGTGDLSAGERARDALREWREVRPEDGPRPLTHDLSRCRYAPDCWTCRGKVEAERAYRAALAIIFPAGDDNGR